MNDGTQDDATWADAALALALMAVDPAGCGGVLLRGGPGPARDAICAQVAALLPAGARSFRVPSHITEDRLLGGISLEASLKEGRAIGQRGLLAEAHGGVLILTMAERIEGNTCSHLCAVLDRQQVQVEREGISATVPCSASVVALDEGIGDESAPMALRDRLAFSLELDALKRRSSYVLDVVPSMVVEARRRLPYVELHVDLAEVLCGAASSLGIDSLRAPILASAVARAHAALQGRSAVDEVDIAAAARLVLGPRATRIPIEDGTPPESSPEQADQGDGADAPDSESVPERDDRDEAVPATSLAEVVLESAKSGVQPGLLALSTPTGSRRGSGPGSKAGARRASRSGGRPAGTRAAVPRDGERLHILETLRAAAPWQRLRRAESAPSSDARRVQIRRADFRVTRFVQRSETCVIFTVDASGSSALQRLAEAKGAVEAVLSDCYSRRDHVALIGFRGDSATLLLPPTRSLARVRRSLAGLAGGGTTPLASGIDAALALALEARKKNQAPIIVLMTDGRGNVSRQGPVPRAADADALECARMVRAEGVVSLMLDTGPRPSARSSRLAAEMGARYLPLPYVSAAAISRAVNGLAAEQS